MKKSKLFSIEWKDFLRGFIIAVVTVILTGAMVSLNAGALPTGAEFKGLALAGLGAGIAYLLKNLLTNSNDQLLKKENK